MTVGFLPIVGRELRTAARRKGTYVARCSAAAAVFVIGAWFYLIMPWAPPATIAQGLFGILSGASVLYAFVSGVVFTSNSISEEKREGTLGLLFLTDLKGYDVVLGKLAATSLSAFYGMLAMLPMLAVPLLIGGVNFTEVLRMSLLSINTMFMSLTAGLFISSMSRAPRQSSGLTFLLLCGFAVILPLLGGWATNGGNSTDVLWWLLGSPGYAFAFAFENSYTSRPERYWICMGALHALAWIYLIAASIITPKSWKDKPIGVNLTLKERLSNLSYGMAKTRADHRRELLSVNPFYWLASRSRTKTAQVWLVLFVLAALWFWGFAEFKRDWLNEGIFITTALVLNTLLKGWFATECTRQISEDRHKGAFELILSTSLSVRDILKGQRLALQRQFLVPMLLVFGVYLLLMIGTAAVVHNDKERSLLLSAWGVGLVVFYLDLVALYWAGIFFALKSRRANQAPSATCFLVLTTPWLLYAGSMIFLVRHGSEDSAFFLWALCQLFVPLVASAITRRVVLNEFRGLALAKVAGR